jgi:hypothetical protein
LALTRRLQNLVGCTLGPGRVRIWGSEAALAEGHGPHCRGARVVLVVHFVRGGDGPSARVGTTAARPC